MTDQAARIVARYQGAQLEDARDKLRVKFDQRPLRTTRYLLLQSGFRTTDSNKVFECPNNPRSIFTAQAILNDVFGGEVQ